VLRTDAQYEPATVASRWRTIVQAVTRPYPVTLPMVVFVALIPFYIVIARLVAGRTLHAPVTQLDALLPLVPLWALVYGVVYLFLIVLPVFVVRHPTHIRRTVYAYLTVWLAAYVCFLVYPTVAPRPASVSGAGFAVWGLHFLYDADPPYNCFPSLHVAHAFVSALTCYRLHRSLGIVALICAALVAVSTLFTKQHYVADVVAGALLACVAYRLFLGRRALEPIPEYDRRVAPLIAVVVAGIVGVALGVYWIAYRLGLPA
jgi:membrane-associated phospholipid phosphatase